MTFGQIKSQTERKIKFIKIPFTPPHKFYFKFYKNFKTSYLLESRCDDKNIARFSFLGFNPKLRVSFKAGICEITGEYRDKVKDVNNPLKIIQKLVGYSKIRTPFPLVGGAIGYVSYDAISYWEKVPSAMADDFDFPDIEMGIYDDGLVFDHHSKEAYYYYTGENRLKEIQSSEVCCEENFSYTKPKPNITKKTFEENVKKAKEYIYAGEIFQVVISKRYEFGLKGDLSKFYLALRELNPSPYMFFYQFEDRKIIGSSPEMLVRVIDKIIETNPIAGTCPVSANNYQNRILAEKLLSDPKERAEHIMLVDLARNDLGRICEFGTVNLNEFMKIKKFSHVQHIVSKVTGVLKSDLNQYDVLRATFPAGTVSGAPKIRAMEIIAEIENVRRGPYAGAVGYFSKNGNSDFAITIRSLVANRNRGYIQSGGGIVADSIPEKEYYETEHKAAALIKTLDNAGEIS
ncbi:MAG: anthranilate synthase component I family protein [Candidatus Odinarchaeia archaeon]